MKVYKGKSIEEVVELLDKYEEMQRLLLGEQI